MRAVSIRMACAALLAALLVTPASTQSNASISGASFTLLADGRWLRLGGVRPTGGALADAVVIDSQGTESVLSWRLPQPRAAHTATMQADGRILVLGGFGANGRPASTFVLVNPQAGSVEAVEAPVALQRLSHTATLLLDGSVLVIGGQNGAGAFQESGRWNPSTETFDVWEVPLSQRRTGHTAGLSAAGDVLITGGIGSTGLAPSTIQRYRSSTSDIVEPANPDSAEPTILAETLPLNDAHDVPLDTRIGLRFSAPIDLDSLQPRAIELTDAAGQTIRGDLVPGEGGRLVFLTAAASLEPATLYRVGIRGLRDLSGVTLPARAITFTTSGDRPQTNNGDDETVVVDAFSRTLPPLRARPGETALSGQVLRLNGGPLRGVALEMDGKATRSDISGRFLLTGLTAGHHALLIDGRPASAAERTYGIFEAGVDVAAAQTTVLPYTIWMTPIDMAHAVTIPSPTTTETVITTPRLPGLELRIPAGTTITGRDGQVVTQVSITQVPIDRPPFPLPAGVHVPIYFTIQPGAAYLHNASGTKARLVYPNLSNQPIGTPFDFWNYDADQRGWFVYGQGHVVQPGGQIAPDPGVGIYEFTGAMVANPNLGPPPPGPPPGCGTDCKGGDPVDLYTGLFVYKKTDAYVPDVLPLKLERVYRPNDTRQRPFGVGATHPYELLLLGDTNPYTYVDLILPDGGRIHYPRISSGTGFADAVYEHTATPSKFYKSQVKWNGTAWDLTLLDGLVFTFPEAFGQTVSAKAALVGIRDRYGNRITFVRDSSTGNLTKLVSPNGRSLSFTYDGSNRVTSVTDNIGRATQYAYDTGGRLTTVTDPDSYTTQYTYDSSGRMLTIRDRRSIVFLTMVYDANGRVSQQTLADSHTYQFAYTLDANGNATQTDVTDQAGIVRRVVFNTAGYITSDTKAFGLSEAQTTTFVRSSPSNLITSTTDALGRQTTYAYDSAGQPTSITRLAGTSSAVTTSFTYEPLFHSLASVTDPLSHLTTLKYDSVGNVIQVVNALNQATTRSYSSTGQPLTVTDPLSHTTSLTYSGGDVTSITNPIGSSWSQFLDAAGRPLTITDPLGRITSLTHDGLDRTTAITDALNVTTGIAFDANGNLSSLTDAKNHAVAFTYDNLDQVATRTDPLSQQDAYTFDLNGWLHQQTDRKGQVTTYTHDGLGRVTGITYADSSTTALTYDAGNRVTQVVDSAYGTMTRSYTGLDQLSSETTPQGTVSYTYDAAGRRSTMTVTGQTAMAYGYDSANHLTSITQGTTVVSFAYDDAGRRTTTTYPNGVVATYGYDVASRLTSLTFTNGGSTLGTLTYAYDAAGNRTLIGGTLGGTTLPAAVTTTVFDAANRLTTRDSTSLIYDLAGNLTSDGTNTYTWNARNQLTSISGGTSASFAYDPLGRRSTRTIGSTTTKYLYDGLNAVQEMDGSLSTIANLITGLGLDETFVRTDGAGTVSLLADALGSIVALANASGAIATQYTYGPFGQVSVTGAPSTNSSQFTGRENDGTGLYYYRSRYYSPGLGRFISDDPVGLVGGINATTYVGDNPLMFVDPLGLQSVGARLGAWWRAFWPVVVSSVMSAVEVADSTALTVVTDVSDALQTVEEGIKIGLKGAEIARKHRSEWEKTCQDMGLSCAPPSPDGPRGSTSPRDPTGPRGPNGPGGPNIPWNPGAGDPPGPQGPAGGSGGGKTSATGRGSRK